MNICDLLVENPMEELEEEVKIGIRKNKQDGKYYDIICKIKTISHEDYYDMRRKCIKTINGQKDMDVNKFQDLICLEGTVEPNFKKVEFMNKLNVKTPVEALNKVLSVGEKDYLYKEISKLNGYGVDLTEKIEEVKKQ